MTDGTDIRKFGRFFKSDWTDDRKIQKESRARLKFYAIKDVCPELAAAVLMIRDRANYLKDNFRRDADWALTRFNITAYVTIAVSACAVGLGVYAAVVLRDVSWNAVFFITMGSIVAMVASGLQAFGWHKRYGAMFSARWAMNALVIRIDQEVLRIALSLGDTDEMSPEMRRRLHEALNRWVDEMALVLATFGKACGAALEPMKLRNLVGNLDKSN